MRRGYAGTEAGGPSGAPVPAACSVCRRNPGTDRLSPTPSSPAVPSGPETRPPHALGVGVTAGPATTVRWEPAGAAELRATSEYADHRSVTPTRACVVDARSSRADGPRTRGLLGPVPASLGPQARAPGHSPTDLSGKRHDCPVGRLPTCPDRRSRARRPVMKSLPHDRAPRRPRLTRRPRATANRRRPPHLTPERPPLAPSGRPSRPGPPPPPGPPPSPASAGCRSAWPR
jgi:hypothetical protein